MKIGFMTHRRSYYKVYAPIIEEFLKRGHSVCCLQDHSSAQQSEKSYDIPTDEHLPRFQNGRPQVVSWRNPQELFRQIVDQQLDTVIVLNHNPLYVEVMQDLTESRKVFWISIQHASDILLIVKELPRYDKVLLYSSQWKKWVIDAFKQTGSSEHKMAELSVKIVPVGHTELDTYSMISAQELRKRWGIPEGKRVVLLLPFPFDSSIDRLWTRFIYGQRNSVLRLLASLVLGRLRWIKQALRQETDERVVLALRKFCDRNNAFLIVKSRLKDKVRPYSHANADKVLYDDDFYPSTMAQCLAISDLCIHFSSFVVYEAAFRGVPSLAILPEPRDYEDFRLQTSYVQLKDAMTVPGVSQTFSIPDALDKLPTLRLDQFKVDSKSRSSFVRTYLEFDDSSASIRSVDEILNLKGSRLTHV